MRSPGHIVDSTRGAIVVHTALVLVALIAFLAMSIDLGVQYAGRNQTQNGADAGALAAATSLAFVSSTNFGLAQSSGMAAARQNSVWGQTPDVLATDIVRVNPCPPGAPGVPDSCVQASVYRTNYGRANGNPLPTFFANMVGLSEQGARATATAQMLASNGTADCVKPWGLPDRWIENRNPANEFNRYVENGNNRGDVLPNPDVYDPTQGYQLPRDYGRFVRLYDGNPNSAIQPGFFQPVVLDPGNVGGRRYQDAIEGCVTTAITPGMVLQPEPGRMVGPTGHGFENLIAMDPSASWDPAANGGLGAPVGGCAAAGTCSRSPRLVAVPVFDVDAYMVARLAQGPGGGGGGRNLPINVMGIVGVWIDEVRNNNDINGYITYYPTVSLTGPVNLPGAFARTLVLVR